MVDHIGADIIAVKDAETKNEIKYAISVKGRNFPDSESKSTQFDKHNAEMLADFADSFGMIPAIAFVFTDNMENNQKIRVFLITLDALNLKADDDSISYIKRSKSTGGGYIFNTQGRKNNLLSEIKKDPSIDYTELTMSHFVKDLAI